MKKKLTIQKKGKENFTKRWREHRKRGVKEMKRVKM